MLSTPELLWNWLLKVNGILLSNPAALIVGDPVYLADLGLAGQPITVQGRYYHSVQVSGLIGSGDSVQIQSTNDGVNWANLGAAITANGFTQLTSGLYRALKAVLSTGSGATTVGVGGSTAGATSLLVADSSSFPSAGAAKVGAGGTQDWITFTSKDATHLIGIPATGVGSLTNAHAQGEDVVQALPPALRVSLESSK